MCPLMHYVLRPAVWAAACGLALAWAVTALTPTVYTASASVLLPQSSEGASRVVRINHAAFDAAEAVAFVDGRLRELRGEQAVILDELRVLRNTPETARNLALGALGGLLLGGAFAASRIRQRRVVRTEVEFAQALGAPLLAARPLREASLDDLARQLLEHWFTAERRLLPIVSAEAGEGRSRLAAALATRLALMGEKVLLVDADFRSPSVHEHFGLPNRAGLADFLEGRETGIAQRGENLGIIVAGSCRCDPLEALASPRLPALLVEAGRHFRAIIIDTPAASRGPDLQMPAALAGGALVVARPGPARGPALEQLRAHLQFGAARVVTTLINQG